MANTFELIASSTVGSGGAANIEFTSIPSTFTDLVLMASTRGTNAQVGNDINMSLNGSTTSFTYRYLFGDGSSASSASGTSGYIATGNGNGSTASTFGTLTIYIPNYAGSTNKSSSIDSVGENNATAGYGMLMANLWSNTSAITSIRITGISNFAQYSTAYLYGVKNA
jgi:hypothetical protein